MHIKHLESVKTKGIFLKAADNTPKKKEHSLGEGLEVVVSVNLSSIDHGNLSENLKTEMLLEIKLDQLFVTLSQSVLQNSSSLLNISTLCHVIVKAGKRTMVTYVCHSFYKSGLYVESKYLSETQTFEQKPKY